MSAINKEGMLVVFASPLENVPYTLAEVAVTGIPLLTFDVGGATELIDPKTHEDLFCGMATVSLLRQQVNMPCSELCRQHRIGAETCPWERKGKEEPLASR